MADENVAQDFGRMVLNYNAREREIIRELTRG